MFADEIFAMALKGMEPAPNQQ